MNSSGTILKSGNCSTRDLFFITPNFSTSLTITWLNTSNEKCPGTVSLIGASDSKAFFIFSNISILSMSCVNVIPSPLFDPSAQRKPNTYAFSCVSILLKFNKFYDCPKPNNDVHLTDSKVLSIVHLQQMQSLLG